jgi:phytanoyl-CoA hydroxylase
MAYPTARPEDLDTFWRDGYLVVRGAVEPRDLERLQGICDELLANKERVAFDWAWEAGTDKDHRAFKIVQTSPSLLHKGELERERFRVWSTEFASALLGQPVEFWYDQFLAKPPREGARTPWHQDEGYWGRNLDERGITCWLPFHDVDVANGCMHFVPGAHKKGVVVHRPVEGVQSDLLVCEVDEASVVPVPIQLGDVTFHHGKMPHMTTPNASPRWRRALSQHFRVVGSKGEGDHYPWKIYVNQITGQRIKPVVR